MENKGINWRKDSRLTNRGGRIRCRHTHTHTHTCMRREGGEGGEGGECGEGPKGIANTQLELMSLCTNSEISGLLHTSSVSTNSSPRNTNVYTASTYGQVWGTQFYYYTYYDAVYTIEVARDCSSPT